MRLKKEPLRIFAVSIVIGSVVFISYATVFLASERAHGVLQSIMQVFDSAIYTLMDRRRSEQAGSADSGIIDLDDAAVETAILRFNDLSTLLWFKEAVLPSRSLELQWKAWKSGDSQVLADGPAISSAAERQLIKSFIDADTVLDGIGKKVRTSFDLLFLLFGFILSMGTAGSVAFYAESNRSRMRQELLRNAFRLALQAEEDTNKSVAMQLHDDVAQDIASARMLCERIAVSPDAGLAGKASAILGELNVKIRNLSANLHPPEIKTLGLGAALAALCSDIERRFDYPLKFAGDSAMPRMPEFAELAVYRIMNEAAVNACKHADKGGALLQCGIERISDAEESFFFILRDDGFASETDTAAQALLRAAGLGMNAMKERAATIDAELRIELNENGSQVRLTVPVNADRSSA